MSAPLLITAEGNAGERGHAIGRATGPMVRRYLAAQPATGGQPESPEGAEMLPFIAAYAPETLAELEGFAAGAEVEFGEVLGLTLGYDRFIRSCAAAPAKCTSFAATGPATSDGRLLCGENNDEGAEWLAFGMDIVVHHLAPDGLQALVYTHAGMPAYFGMNSAGLCVLWMTILGRNIAPGLATTVLIRELLRHRRLAEAEAYLRSVPRYCPNAFILAHAADGICTIECDAGQCIGVSTSSQACHANHIVLPDWVGDDPLRARPDHTTFPRHQRMSTLLTEHHGRIDLAAAQAFLRNRDDGGHSILALPADGLGWQTIASIVCRPDTGEMFIATGAEPGTTYHRYGLRGC